MTRILRYIAVVATVCVGLAGCGGSHNIDARLAQVNDLANAGEADSAIALLQSIEKTSLNEYNSRYHDLMDIKTRDKADADITGDTAIVDIMEYFDDEGPDEVRGEAYYYGGRVYREMGDAPQALDYYQKAQDAYPQDQAFMKGKIASQMGQIFLELYMFDHAKTKFQEAIHHQKACKDTRGEVLNYHSLGESYQWLNKLDSAMCCFNEALKLIDEIKNNKRIKIEIHTAKIDLFIKQKDFDNALQEFKHIEPYLHENYISNSTLATAINIYTHKKELDKAEAYSNRLVDTGSLYGKKFGYKRLLEIANYKQQKTKLYDYIQKYKSSLDSANNTASTNAVIHQNSLYNYALREKESSTLKQKQQLLKQNFYLIAVCFLVVVCLLLYAMYRNRKLKLQLALQINNLMKIQNGDINENKILNNESITLQELQIEYHKEYNKLIQDIDPENYIIPDSILKSKVYQRIKQNVALNKNISSNDLHKLDLLINDVHKSFTLKIRQFNNKISEHEHQICLLTKCKFSNIDISNITNRERSSITKAKTRLYFKLFKEIGSAKDFDKFILSL